MSYGITNLANGTRIQLHPATDLWMRGARYGTIVYRHRHSYVVRLDVNGRLIGLRFENVSPID